MTAVDTGVWVFAIVCTGAGLVTGWVERRNATTRALSVWLVVMGLSVAWGGWMLSTGITMTADLLSATLESGAIIAGIEWGRRVALGARGRWRRVASVLFLTAQGVALVFWLLRLGYTLLFPEIALSPRDGLISARGVEFAVFAPLIGVIMLLSGIALIGLLVADIDRAERTRVRAFMLASPLLLSGLMLGTVWAPLVMSLGLIVFFAGSIRYLVIQVARGVRLRQFVAAEVAGLVEDDRGLLERRERREISIVACDLRGFTALARERPSEAVMALLERYYAEAGRLAAQHGAAVKDHAGDGILMLVGAPIPVPDPARRALRLAQALLNELHPMMQRDAGGLGLGVGVATGQVSIGAVRGAGRLEYAAVGSAVNLAARLCSVAAPGEALIDDATRQAAGDAALASRDLADLKGFPTPLAVFSLAATPA